jgi:putative oxidoreductase
MTNLNTPALIVARVFLSLIFIGAGLSKLGDVEGFVAYMTSGGVPGVLAWPVIAFEILGGIAILVGFQARIVAVALAGFCLLSGVMFHLEPDNAMQMQALMKNIAIAGGFLVMFVHGPGALSWDARRV